MKNLIIVLLTLATSLASAQITANWKGGSPGQETNWNYAKNWSNNQVPDEFTHVVIAIEMIGHLAQPVINDYASVATVKLHSGSSLTISGKGTLEIDGEFTYSNGIVMYGGFLFNNGKIMLSNVEFLQGAFRLDNIQGTGRLFIDGEQMNGDILAQN